MNPHILCMLEGTFSFDEADTYKGNNSDMLTRPQGRANVLVVVLTGEQVSCHTLFH